MQKELKVVLTTPMFLPMTGGTENYVRGLAEFAAARGHQVSVLTLNVLNWRPTVFPDSSSFGTINVNRLSVSQPKYWFLRHALMIAATKDNSIVRKSGGAQVLHFNGMTDFTFPFILRKTEIPRVLSCHGLYETLASLRRRKLFVRSIFQTIDRFHVFSEKDALILRRTFSVPEERITVIRQVVDVSRYKPGLGRNGKVILYVGRIAYTKGLDVLVHACRLVGAPFELRIVGPAYDRRYLEKVNQLLRRLPDHGFTVKFLGRVGSEELKSLYSSADIYVLPSRMETLPLSLLEAMSSGVPAVATDVGNVREAVEDNITGFVVPPDSPHALAEKIQALLGNDALRVNMGVASRQVACDKFSAERNFSSMMQLYDQIAGEREQN